MPRRSNVSVLLIALTVSVSACGVGHPAAQHEPLPAGIGPTSATSQATAVPTAAPTRSSAIPSYIRGFGEAPPTTPAASPTHTAVPSTRVVAALPSPTAQSQALSSPRPAPLPPAKTMTSVRPSTTITLSGRSNWVLFVGATYRANGYQATCDASNGALTLWGHGGTVLARIANPPTVQSHSVDASGNESFQCNMPFSVTVPRSSMYAIKWSNSTPYPNAGCTNSKSAADTEYVHDSGQAAAAFPVISFTLLCTG